MYLNQKFVLENVASVSEMLLTVECVITEVKKRRASNANARWNARNDVTRRVAEKIYI